MSDAQQAEQATQLNQSLGLYEQASEPVAWMVYTEDGKSVYVTDNPEDIGETERALPLFAHPARPVVRVPMSQEQIDAITEMVDWKHGGGDDWAVHFCRAVERYHGITGDAK